MFLGLFREPPTCPIPALPTSANIGPSFNSDYPSNSQTISGHFCQNSSFSCSAWSPRWCPLIFTLQPPFTYFNFALRLYCVRSQSGLPLYLGLRVRVTALCLPLICDSLFKCWRYCSPWSPQYPGKYLVPKLHNPSVTSDLVHSFTIFYLLILVRSGTTNYGKSVEWKLSIGP